MSAFLFIPAAVASDRTARRVDLRNIASLFAEAEEASPSDGRARKIVRLGAAVLLLLLGIGDTLLVTRPGAFAACPAVPTVGRPTL